MRVLAIDTALAACSAAVLDTGNGGIVASESLLMARGHAEALMPLVERVVKKSGIGFAELERVVVTTGPGSFTGLRVGISAARGLGVATDIPVVGVTTLSAYAAPYLAADDQIPVVVAIDARHDHVYLQVFGAGGRTLVAPRLAPLADAIRAASEARTRIVGTAAKAVAAGLAGTAPAPVISRRARSTRYRLGRADRRCGSGSTSAAEAAISAGAGRAAAIRRLFAAAMIGFLSRLFKRGDPIFADARPRDAAAIAAIHAASFQRGWGEEEIYRLLIETSVVAHRAAAAAS